MPKKSKDDTTDTARGGLVQASYNAGLAEGRLQAIEESIDAVANLIVKAEAMIAAFTDETSKSTRDNADHTLRALHLAFAAVTGSKSGSSAFNVLLDQSKERLQKGSSTMH